MYYTHFGLAKPPFKITPDTDSFFSGGNRGPVLEALLYAITQGDGIIKVTGEVGSGKTMLCSMLQSRLPPTVVSVYLANPGVSPDEILRAIAFELEISIAPQAARLEVMHALHSYLVEQHAAGRRVVLFAEESQTMPLETLEEIRLLSNLETKTDKLLQIVMFGQPELDVNLSGQNIRQLRDRIAHSFRLEPLTAEEIHEYLMFRMRAAGYRGPDLFSRQVVRHIRGASQGLTRRVNLIADKMLLAAFADNTHTIAIGHVRSAVRDTAFGDEVTGRRGSNHRLAAAVALTALVTAAVTYLLVDWQKSGSPPQIPATSATSSQSSATSGAAATPASPAGPTTTANQSAAPIQASPQQATTTIPTPAAPPANKQLAGTNEPRGTQPPSSAQAITGASPVHDLLAERMAATKNWLVDTPATVHTVQLLGVESEDQLRKHLNQISKTVETNDIFVYLTRAQGKPSYTVSYGVFDSRQAARNAIATLPPTLKTNRPIARSVSGIRAELGLTGRQ
jgi:MSHA biogenesis protein MshM